jgi:hypothetical protein
MNVAGPKPLYKIGDKEASVVSFMTRVIRRQGRDTQRLIEDSLGGRVPVG